MLLKKKLDCNCIVFLDQIVSWFIINICSKFVFLLVKSGSFVHDVVLGTKSWQASKAELRALSAEMIKLAAKDLKFERLEVNCEVAMEMFKDSRYKSEQLPNISQQNHGRVILYRMGRHIDISRGPMIASSRFLGKCTITAAHKLSEEGTDNAFYRIQGVALPNGFVLNHVAYGTLEDRARKLVRSLYIKLLLHNLD